MDLDVFRFDRDRNAQIMNEAVRGTEAFGAIRYQISQTHQRMADANRLLAIQNCDLTTSIDRGNATYRTLFENHKALEATEASLRSQLQLSHNNLDNAEQHRIDLQQRLDAEQEVTADLRATTERWRQQNEELEAKSKELESTASDATEVKKKCEEQISKLEEEVKERKARENSSVEANNRHENECEVLKEETTQLQSALDSERADRKASEERLKSEHGQVVGRMEQDQRKELDGIKARHKKDVHGLKMTQVEEIKKLKCDRDEDVSNMHTAQSEHIAKMDFEKAEGLKALQHAQRETDIATSNLLALQKQLDASKAELSSKSAQAASKQKDLCKVRQELAEAKVTVADEQERVKAAQKDASTARACEVRQIKLLKDKQATWDRKKTEASMDSKKQAADLKQLRTKLQASQKDNELTNGKINKLTADKGCAEEESKVLRARVKELEGQSAAELLDTADARNEVKDLQSQLQQKEAAVAIEMKKTEEIRESAKKYKHLHRAFLEIQGEEHGGSAGHDDCVMERDWQHSSATNEQSETDLLNTPTKRGSIITFSLKSAAGQNAGGRSLSPSGGAGNLSLLEDHTISDRPGDAPQNAMSVSSGGIPSRPTSSGGSIYGAKDSGKKRSLERSTTCPPPQPKKARGGRNNAS